MRRYLCLLLAFLLLCPVSQSSASKPQFLALIFEGFPSGPEGRILLEGLARRDARATFFLWAPPWEQGRRILDGGHEIGLLLPESLNTLSRRQVAAKLRGTQALLPPCRVRLLLSREACSDGVRQVAKARHLFFQDPGPDLRHNGAPGETVLNRIQPGDTLRLRASTRTDVTQALYLVDQLRDRGFTLISASEMARLEQTALD